MQSYPGSSSTPTSGTDHWRVSVSSRTGCPCWLIAWTGETCPMGTPCPNTGSAHRGVGRLRGKSSGVTSPPYLANALIRRGDRDSARPDLLNRSSMLGKQGKEVAMYDVEDPRREGYTSPWGGAPETPSEPAPPPAPSAEPPPERTWETVDRMAEPAGEMGGTAEAETKKAVKRADTTGKKVSTRARGAAKKPTRKARAKATRKKATSRRKTAARKSSGRKSTTRRKSAATR